MNHIQHFSLHFQYLSDKAKCCIYQSSRTLHNKEKRWKIQAVLPNTVPLPLCMCYLWWSRILPLEVGTSLRTFFKSQKKRNTSKINFWFIYKKNNNNRHDIINYYTYQHYVFMNVRNYRYQYVSQTIERIMRTNYTIKNQ